MALNFKIYHQTINITNNEKLVAGSQNYVKALFEFDDSWSECTVIRAIFKVADNTKKIELVNNECIVPDDLLLRNGFLAIGVEGECLDKELKITVGAIVLYICENTEQTAVIPVGSGSGASGKDGKSAYELAVENGFNGTVIEWLDSLQGAPGAMGPIGPAGETGEKGDKGEKGDAGDTGANGRDGYSPMKGTDYWTQEDIAAIKAYVNEAILGGEW